MKARNRYPLEILAKIEAFLAYNYTYTLDVPAHMEEEMGPGMKSLSIGPAGENGVPFACVGSESYRQMGRGGVGTLFGSKKLKAIAVRGTGGVQVAEIGEFWGAVSEHLDGNLMTIDNQWAKDQGTPMLVDVTNEMGIHPTRNFTRGVNRGGAGHSFRRPR